MFTKITERDARSSIGNNSDCSVRIGGIVSARERERERQRDREIELRVIADANWFYDYSININGE